MGLHKNDKCEIVMVDKTSPPPPPPPPKIVKSCNECNMWHLLAFTIHWAVKNRTNSSSRKSQFFKGIQDGVPRTARGSTQERGHTGSAASKGNVNLKNLEGEEWNTPEFILNNLAEEASGGPPSHRQPPEIVWTNQGDYLTAMDDIEMEEGTSGVPRAPGAPVYGVEPTGDTESESSEESRSQIT